MSSTSRAGTSPAPAHGVRRPVTGADRRNDALLAVAVCVGALVSVGLSTVAGVYGSEQAPLGMSVAYAFVIAAPLAMRRRWPSAVAVVVATAYFLAVTLHVPELYAGNVAVFIGFYTVGAWSSDRRRAALVRGAIVIGMFAWLLVTMFHEAVAPTTTDSLSRAGAFSPFVAYTLLNILVNVLYFGGAYWFGERAYASGRQHDVLEERTAELERERERTAAQAVALERVRIARELHDVVAHHVSLMGVQAGAARAVMANDPDAARGILSDVETAARTAIGELRQLLETLRAPGEPPADTGPTTVGLGALPALVASVDAAGLATSLTVVGDAAPVPGTVGVTLYRIAQEALTNARRHAGATATADVRLRYAPGRVELEVTNTGRRVTSVVPGLGMVGMRERAAAAGGTIELAPRPQGGFLVRVSAPTGAGA